MLNVNKVAVIGAGTMGSRIAAHFVNIGVRTVLLDIVGKQGGDRDAVAARGLKTAAGDGGFFRADLAEAVTLGNVEDDLGLLSDVDLVVEAVFEDRDVKRAIWEQIVAYASPTAVLGTNTSGLPINEVADGLPAEARGRFLGVHFFNPPRHMKLVELVPIADTDPQTVAAIRTFLEHRMGKGVVVAKDTPNFVGNRIGMYTNIDLLQRAVTLGLTVEQADALAGPLMGRPRSGVFRLIDLVGLDIATAVASNMDRVADEAHLFRMPQICQQLIDEGRVGAKTKAGFYTKRGRDLLQVDLGTGEYGPVTGDKPVIVAEAMAERDLGRRLNHVIAQDGPEAQFVWHTLANLFIYSAEHVPQIVDDYRDLDRALVWGFNWTHGPFQMWDLMGFEQVCARLEADGRVLPGWIAERRAEGGSLYPAQAPATTARPAADWTLDHQDRILTFTNTAPHNTITSGVVDGLIAALDELEHSDAIGLIVRSNGPDFSFGANLAQMAEAIKADQWAELDRQVAAIQEATYRLKYAKKPVVTIVQGRALGGGAEVVMHSPFTVAAAESYIGLVEIGVGLLPAGGGTKELAVRAIRTGAFSTAHPDEYHLREALFRIGQAQVSTSAPDAQRMGFLTERSVVVMDPDRLVPTARRVIEQQAEAGYIPPLDLPFAVHGTGTHAAFMFEVNAMLAGGMVSEYDASLLDAIARVLTGGQVPRGTVLTEHDLLTAEREAFVNLCRQDKTLERITHMLRTGKPLRN